MHLARPRDVARLRHLKGLDLTLEYSYNDIAAARTIGHDEFPATLRLRF